MIGFHMDVWICLVYHLHLPHVMLQGSNVSQPSDNVTHTGEGGICTPGSECPNGTTYPVPCMAGYYAPNPQMDACLDCPAGMT